MCNIDVNRALGNNKNYHTSTDFSFYKSLLLKLAKSLEYDYLPEKGVIVEKTITQFRISQSAPLLILWRHVIVVSAMPFLEHYVAFVHFHVEKFNFRFGMIKQLKYTILEVSKILVSAPPREIDLVSGNQNLANSLNGIL